MQPRAELGILLGHRLLRTRVHDTDIERAGDLVARGLRFGEVVAGVEKEHVDSGQLLGHQMGERRVGHRAGDGHRSGREVARDPRDDVGGGRLALLQAAQLALALRGERFELLVGALGGDARCQ